MLVWRHTEQTDEWEEKERERRAKIEFEFHHSRSVFRLNNDDHFVIGFFLFKTKKKKKEKERVGDGIDKCPCVILAIPVS